MLNIPSLLNGNLLLWLSPNLRTIIFILCSRWCWAVLNYIEPFFQVFFQIRVGTLIILLIQQRVIHSFLPWLPHRATIWVIFNEFWFPLRITRIWNIYSNLKVFKLKKNAYKNTCRHCVCKNKTKFPLMFFQGCQSTFWYRDRVPLNWKKTKF